MTQILTPGKVLIAAMVAAWVGGFATPESAPFVADYQANAFEEGGDIAIDCAAYSVVGAQVRLAGEFLDLQTSTGVPVLVNAAAWSQVVCPPLADDEAHQLRAAAATITPNLARWQR
jgi:hypothetical protein